MIEKSVKCEAMLRLKRIESPIRDIQKMITGDRLYNNMVVQLSAAEKAINRVSLVLLKGHIEKQISDLILRGNSKDKINELVNNFSG
jgi:DNA-binding FrmR family transcriptional regulator